MTVLSQPAPQRPASRTVLRPTGHRLLGSRLVLLGDKPGAIAAFMAAVNDQPDDPDLHTTIASLLCDVGQFDAAIGAGLLAVTHGPHSATAHAELGRALFLAGHAHDALAPCAMAVVLAPRNVGAIVTLGAALVTIGRYQAAMDVTLEALAIDPRHFQARGNLALALDGLGRADDAQAQARIALAMDPSNPHARHNLAVSLLSAGQLTAEAWQLYDGRLGLTADAQKLAAIPRWTGCDVDGRTVLLHAEQGFGDTIQFLRFAPMVAARGARVILAVQPALTRLLHGVPGVDQCVAIGGALPAHDVFCPVASLPGIFGVTLDSIPAGIPYIAPPADAIARFRPAPASAMQVGLVWAGNPGFVHDRARSMDGAALQPLRAMPCIVFHNLQKGAAPPFPMQDRMPDTADFADTAAIIAGLDLVIAVDTAVAHLAGAMGRPVWLLSRHAGCWRWLRGRSDTPWYPTMRIFRQASPGDWDGVMADVMAALAERVATRRAVG